MIKISPRKQGVILIIPGIGSYLMDWAEVEKLRKDLDRTEIEMNINHHEEEE